MPPTRKRPVRKKPAAKKKAPARRRKAQVVEESASSSDGGSVSSLTESSDESSGEEQPPVEITETRKREFMQKWSQLMLTYNMNLSFDPLSEEQRKTLQAVVKNV
jgi:hypothetical protein